MIKEKKGRGILHNLEIRNKRREKIRKERK
jgi:hypothetical protein